MLVFAMPNAKEVGAGHQLTQQEYFWHNYLKSISQNSE